MKLGKCKNHAVFNLRCKKIGLVRRSLQCRSPVPSFRARKITERAGHQLVRERLRLSELRKKELEDEKKWIEIGLKRIGEQRFNDWSRMVETKGEKVFLRMSEVQWAKLSKLVEKTN